MKRIIWLPTLKCNYHCPYCYMVKIPKHYPERPSEDWLQVLQERTPLWIDISGGEPFLYLGLINLMKRVPERHTVSITTNLSRPTELNQIIDRIYSTTLSFHPTYESLHSFLPKAKEVHSKCHNVTVNIVAYPEFLPRLHEWVNSFETEGLRVHVEPYISHERPYTERERQIVKSYTSDRALGWYNNVKPRTCDAGIVSEYWLPNGDVFTCSTAFRIHTFINPLPNYMMGNLFSDYAPRTKPFKCNLPCVMGCDLDARRDIWGIFRRIRNRLRTAKP